MPKKNLLIIGLLLSSMANAMERASGMGAKVQKNSAVADEAGKTKVRSRPWVNTPAQDKQAIMGCLKMLSIGVVVITGTAALKYMQMQQHN